MKKAAAHGFAGSVDVRAIDHRIGAREIHVFEEALRRARTEVWMFVSDLLGMDASAIDAHEFTRGDVAQVGGAYQVERAGFARDGKTAFAGKFAQAKRADAREIAQRIEDIGRKDHD